MSISERKPLVVFGDRHFADLTAYCITHDAGRTVAAFTVNRAFLRSATHEGYAVTPFETLTETHPPGTHDILLPLGFKDMNGFREKRCKEAKSMGYHLASFVSSRANIWADLTIGENVIIFEQAIIQAFATLGDNVIIRSGANIGHHSQVGSHSFIASGVVTGGGVTIADHCWIGLGAVVRDNLVIAERCFIGAGAVITRDTEPGGVYVGNPARRLLDRTSADITR